MSFINLSLYGFNPVEFSFRRVFTFSTTGFLFLFFFFWQSLLNHTRLFENSVFLTQKKNTFLPTQTFFPEIGKLLKINFPRDKKHFLCRT